MTSISDNDQNDSLNINQNFAATLRALRKEKGLTQHDLSDGSGLSLRMISDLECGARQPTLGSIFKLAKAFNISVSEVIERLLKEMDL